METNKLGLLGLAGALLVIYNVGQPGLVALRNNETKYKDGAKREAYGPSLVWLDRLAAGSVDENSKQPKLDFSVMSSLMVAGLASGFKSQVANLLWMKSDEYWHQGMFTRQVPLMEAVVTLDPQFIDAWSTAGWHWAYNIYADIPTNPDNIAKGPKYIREKQVLATDTGETYLQRGANLNPDTYRLWFEWGWTRAEKSGKYDEETLEKYRIARTKTDARTLEMTNADGSTKKVEGMDVLGRTIGHLYERIPEFDKALEQYADDLMKATPEQKKMLDAAGGYWRKYGSEYNVIRNVYEAGDDVTKAQIRKLVPDIDRLVAAQKMRETIAAQPAKDQPVGAYVSITARYMPAWDIMKQGDAKRDNKTKPDYAGALTDYKRAIANMIGVMNADPKYTLQGLAVMGKIYEIRGDSPQAAKEAMEQRKTDEKNSSQDLGLHFLAKLYERAAAVSKLAKNDKEFNEFTKQAYETWYRSRERDALDFYARRNTFEYEKDFNFTPPQNIIDEIKKSRKGGVPNAAPAVPPNIAAYR